MDEKIQTILKDSTSTKNTSTKLDQPLNLFIKTITKFRLPQKIFQTNIKKYMKMNSPKILAQTSKIW